MKLGVVIVVEVGFQLLVRVGGWMGGWSEKTKVIPNSVEVEVEVGVELAKKWALRAPPPPSKKN